MKRNLNNVQCEDLWAFGTMLLIAFGKPAFALIFAGLAVIETVISHKLKNKEEQENHE